tara:strand:+ start:1187 stop:1336 length:150 start_codon:yes stop_codon:yes gene_type:complete
MAIEKENIAAKAAQAKVNNIAIVSYVIYYITLWCIAVKTSLSVFNWKLI